MTLIAHSECGKKAHLRGALTRAVGQQLEGAFGEDDAQRKPVLMGAGQLLEGSVRASS